MWVRALWPERTVVAKVWINVRKWRQARRMVRTCLCWRVGLWQGIWAIELDSQSGAGSRRGRNSRLRSLFIKGWFSGLLHMAGQMVLWSKVPSQGAKWRLTPSLPPLHQAMHPSPGGGCLSNSKVPEPWQLGHQFVSLPDLLTTGTPWWHLHHPYICSS